MAVLAEIMEALRRWDAWKRVEDAPQRVDALEERIAALEKNLARCPGEGCPSCGELAYRAQAASPHPRFGHTGARLRKLRCEECGFEDERTIMPGK